MRVISFDVFDTVLTRTCAEPRDLFVQVGERLRASRSDMPSPLTFAAGRRQAEQNARQRAPAREVSLDDIYVELAKLLQWDAAQRDTAQSLELAVEAEWIRPVPAMRPQVAQARRDAGRVVFISDMYLPSATIRSWLEQAGFWQPGDRLFVSGEAGHSKGSGRLFEKIRDELAGDFAAWTHHGDHPVSDFSRPAGLGLTARHVVAGRVNARERLLRGDGTFAPAWRTLLAGASRLARLDQPPAGDDPQPAVLWATGAGVAGPLYYGFTEWCLAEAERRGLKDLFFLARGGQIFLRIAREIQAARPRAVRVHYLPVSRLALVGSADTDRLPRLRALAVTSLRFHSARQAAMNLGLTLDAQLTPPWLPATEWERNLTARERERLADWLLDATRLPLVQAALRERQLRARAYLQQAGVTADGGLVDTGWMGTIQQQLEFALGSDTAPAKLTGFYLGRTAQPATACAGPTLAYSPGLSRSPLQRVHTARVLIEIMARADHGAVTGYAFEASGVLAPQLGPMDAATVAQVRLFQESVLAFTRHAVAAGPPLAAAPAAELAATVEQVFFSFAGQPTPAEALVFGRLPHSDQMLEQHHAVLCPPMSPTEMLAALLDHRRRPVCWWVEGQAALGAGPLLRGYMALKKAWWRWRSGV